MSDFRVDPIRARAMAQLRWVDPATVLVAFRQIELGIPSNTEPGIRHLRTNSLKEWREARQGLILAYGLSKTVLGHEVLIAKTEEMDYDCIIRWRADNREFFYPLQLKELPPAELNPKVTLDDIFDKLSKYDGKEDLSVAIHINREMRLNYEPWNRKDRPRIKELWLFGGISADQSRWFVYGDMLQERPQYHEFEYPTSGGDAA